MALALILALEPRPTGIAVRFDIGKNRYLRWLLGEEKQITRNGLPKLAAVSQQSELIGPLRTQSLGRGECIVPRQALSRESCCLQLLSYRESDGTGPAVSSVKTLPLGGVNWGEIGATELLPPPVGLAMDNNNRLNEQRENTMTAIASAYTQQVDNTAFALSERKLSQPMFLEAIVAALPTLIPMLAPAIGTLISGMAPAVGQVASHLIRNVNAGSGGAGHGSEATVSQIGSLADQAIRALGPSAQQILTPENMRQIMQLIQAGQNASAPATPTSQALNQYSQAQVAPALLAAIPALMPLLRQVLSPQTVQSIVQAPERMTGQVINGIKDFARLGLEADQQLQQHLERLNPGVDDPALHQLLASLSVEMSTHRARNYKRVASVRLHIEDLQTQVVLGRETTLYQANDAMQFPLSIETPQTIHDAEVMLQLKQADNLRIVHEANELVGEISSGALDVIPRVESNITQSLDSTKEHIIVLTLLWHNRRGQLRGASIQHSFSLMGKYHFDRVEESGELIPLDDRQTYRDYWHQIWEFTFSREMRRVDIQSRYYLTLDPQRNRNARVDSQVRTERGGSRADIHLRAGFEYSLFALNHLMSRLAPDQSPLNDDVLQALASDDFVNRFNQAAQHQGQIRGRPADAAALWVYPEFKIQTLVMVKASRVNENGNVTELTEERVQFPMPVMMHFVGVVQE